MGPSRPTPERSARSPRRSGCARARSSAADSDASPAANAAATATAAPTRSAVAKASASRRRTAAVPVSASGERVAREASAFARAASTSAPADASAWNAARIATVRQSRATSVVASSVSARRTSPTSATGPACRRASVPSSTRGDPTANVASRTGSATAGRSANVAQTAARSAAHARDALPVHRVISTSSAPATTVSSAPSATRARRSRGWPDWFQPKRCSLRSKPVSAPTDGGARSCRSHAARINAAGAARSRRPAATEDCQPLGPARVGTLGTLLREGAVPVLSRRRELRAGCRAGRWPLPRRERARRACRGWR
jgi:hypothetical protein